MSSSCPGASYVRRVSCSQLSVHCRRRRMLGCRATRRSVCLLPDVKMYAVLTSICAVGSEPIDRLAERIWQSVGPSGRNKVRHALHFTITFALPTDLQ